MQRKCSSNVKSKRDKSVSILSKSSVISYSQTPQTKSNTTIAVQTSPSQISLNTINETSYVKELKSQLEVLKSEIVRLQDAQLNLEKTLKQQSTVIRPIIYTGYPDQGKLFYPFFRELKKNIFVLYDSQNTVDMVLISLFNLIMIYRMNRFLKKCQLPLMEKSI